MIFKSVRVITGDVRIGMALEISRYESQIDIRKGKRMMLYWSAMLHAKLSLQKAQ